MAVGADDGLAPSAVDGEASMSRGSRNQCRRTQLIFTSSTGPSVLKTFEDDSTSAGDAHVGQSTNSTAFTSLHR